MMTKQEAFDTYKKSKLCREMPVEICERYEYCTECEAHRSEYINLSELEDVVLEALEKQIPKRPNTNEVKQHWCPYCVNGHTRQMLLDWNYCPNCGQAIDLSDNE